MLVCVMLCVGFMFVFEFFWGWNWVMALSCLFSGRFRSGQSWGGLEGVVGRLLVGGVLVWFGGVRARYEDG